ncbi:MAG: hypothetical protein DRP71_12510 [Verrucomicrobia bacterium]|nr:MAG: hypothetical protein DRP71_12510 [Verrucomicrobiota bacterium]
MLFDFKFLNAPTLLVSASALFLSACQTASYNYDLEVDSVAAVGQRWGPSFAVKPLPGSPADTDVMFGGVASIITDEISGKGLIPVEPGDKPDLIILVDYGMRPPKTVFKTVQVPSTMGTQRVDPLTGLPITTRNRNPMGGTAPMGITYSEEIRPFVIVEKYMIVSAVDGEMDRTKGSRRELANIEVVCNDEREELEPYLPVLAMACGRQIGTPTREVEEVRIRAQR